MSIHLYLGVTSKYVGKVCKFSQMIVGKVLVMFGNSIMCT